MDNSHYKGMFRTNGSGFHLSFDNGWTVSVQWGPMNYCEHYHEREDSAVLEALNDKKIWESKTAEIAAWKNGKEGDASLWYNFGNDTVKGRVSTDEVAAFIVMVADFTE